MDLVVILPGRILVVQFYNLWFVNGVQYKGSMECLNPFGKANLIALDDYLIYRGASQVMYLFFYIYNILFPSETKIMPTLPRMHGRVGRNSWWPNQHSAISYVWPVPCNILSKGKLESLVVIWYWYLAVTFRFKKTLHKNLGKFVNAFYYMSCKALDNELYVKKNFLPYRLEENKEWKVYWFLL